MAGPKEDWLMWDRRFQLGYGVLNQRLKINEEATQQITQLVQQNKNLASSIKHLQEDNDGLRDRIQQLEKQASHKHAQLDEQIQDLTASSGNFKDENKDLNDRILQLKQEGTHRDQQNRLIQGQLKEKLEALEDGFQSVDLAMKEMNGIARLEREQRGKEIQQLRSQIEALVVTRHTSGRHARDSKSKEPATCGSVG